MIEAQIPETYLLAMIGFQSSIATKAARVVKAALGRDVVEFGTRRAHSPEAGVLAGRAAYIGGCVGTSNAEAGFRYKAHVFGTAAHSWVMSFASERAAFEQLQKLLGERTTYLIDTYDTIEGAKLAASLGRPLWGVRLDTPVERGRVTADLVGEVRARLDQAGFGHVKILVSGGLTPDRIRYFKEHGSLVDSFAVGSYISGASPIDFTGDIKEIDGRPIAKRGRIPGLTPSPRLKPVDLAAWRPA